MRLARYPGLATLAPRLSTPRGLRPRDLAQAPPPQQAHPLLQLPDLTGDKTVSFGDEGHDVHLLMQGLHETHIHGPQPAESSQDGEGQSGGGRGPGRGWGGLGEGALVPHGQGIGNGRYSRADPWRRVAPAPVPRPVTHPCPKGEMKYRQQCTRLSWMFLRLRPLSSRKYCSNCWST